MTREPVTWQTIFSKWPAEVNNSYISTVASDLGVSYQRVEKWIERDRVPSPFLSKILDAANRRELRLTASDLVYVGAYR